MNDPSYGVSQLKDGTPSPSARKRLLSLLSAPFTRYAGVGAIGTAVHYLALIVVTSGLKASPTVGAMTGASFGALVNYALNYRLTFASTRGHLQSFPRFLCVAGLGILVSGLCMKLMTSVTNTHYLLGQLFATVVVLLLGFVLNKYWTFGKA